MPRTEAEEASMLAELGVGSFEDLLEGIPPSLRPWHPPDIPPARSEMALSRAVRSLASRNRGLSDLTSFMGMGWTKHFIPAAVDTIVSRSEFTTAYTPYQPEASQGSLRQIFEYQTMIAELTGMEIANASLYDGATALVESLQMASACTRGRRTFALVSALNPRWRDVANTYAPSLGWTFRDVPWTATGQLDRLTAEQILAENSAAALVVASPDVFGQVHDLTGLAALCRAHGAVLVVVADPLSLAVVEPPGVFGADIVIGEMIGMGIPTSLGGPGLGYLATRMAHLRRMPGRVVGQTVDASGRRAWCLTAQTREQHIRREKATSNICTNQGLMTVAATVWLALQGPAGLADVATQCMARLAFVREGLLARGVPPLWPQGPVFQEQAFVLAPGTRARVEESARAADLLPGVWLADHLTGVAPDTLLVCVGETHDRSDLDLLIEVVGRHGGQA